MFTAGATAEFPGIRLHGCGSWIKGSAHNPGDQLPGGGPAFVRAVQVDLGHNADGVPHLAGRGRKVHTRVHQLGR